MTLAAKVVLKNAEKIRMQLLRKGLVDAHYHARREGDFLYIPLKKKAAGVDCVSFVFEEKKEKSTLETELRKILNEKELRQLPRSQEIIGDIMILEIPNELRRKERAIAQVFLKANKHIATIVKKSKIHSGIYRTRKVTVLAGEKKKEAVHRENGCLIRVHIEKMYFSARLAHERQRIATLVKPKEHVLVMFSGCAPYVCVIAKKSRAQVTGIEINPEAHKYAEMNVQRNKLERVTLYQGDVRKILPRLGKFDRVIMPLPKTGEEFLPLAFTHVKPKGIIHYYVFLREEEIASYKKKIKEMCAAAKKKCRVLGVVKAGQHAPYVFRMCFDVKVR
ncbi:MAG TPA: class I SAM-dependent methyltransferase family protein [Candidatus Nanoarchaeia archaeon]|nr:class I SAM-dependent methyltransferase family protein [Candidatus Nanoarchaeia archaeon]